MKKLFTSCLFLTMLLKQEAKAAVAPGTYNLPRPDYPTLASLLNDLNTTGISGTGPVVINLSRAETAPSGGFVLGSTTLNAAANAVTINGGGVMLTAASGTGGTDAIFIVKGKDNVTLDNIKLQEAATNTTATSRMEWGIAGVKLNTDDAIINMSIQNCEITLNNANTTPASGISPYGATGIFIGNCTAISTTALGTPGTMDGAHDGIFLFKNTIKNTNHGIVGYGNLVDAAAGTGLNDKNLTIWQNNITNFTHEGIWMAFFNGASVGTNQINNMSDGGTAPTGNNLYGIAYFGNVNTPTNENWDCFGNNIDLNIACAATYEVYGVFTGVNGTGTTSIYEDTIKLTSTGASAGMIGIYSQNETGTQNIRKNYIYGFTNVGTANMQRVAAIYSGYSDLWKLAYPSGYYYPTTSVIEDNLIEKFLISNGSTDNIGILTVCSDVNLTSRPSVFKNNTITDITLSGNSTRFFAYGSTYLFPGVIAQTATITGNKFANISTAGTPAFTYVIWHRAAYGGRTALVKDNVISKIIGGTATTMGIGVDYGLRSDVENDTLTDIRGNGDVYGIYAGSSAYAVNTVSLIKNQISTINSVTGTACGIRVSPGTSNVTTAFVADNNKIMDVSANGTKGLAMGIYSSSGSYSTDIYNNIISEVMAPINTADYSSSFGMNISSTGANNIYYNTVNLVVDKLIGTSGFGATGLLYNPSGTNKIQNNILRVNMTAGSDNNVSAIRSTGGLASAAPSTSGFTAGSNIYYTPPGPNNYLYVDGTTNSSLVNGYHQSGLTENATKNIVNDTFFNSDCNKSSYHNFMQAASGSREKKTYSENNLSGTAGEFAPSGLSYAEGAALDVPEVSTDFKSNPRPAFLSDIGALEFNGTTRPLMDIVITSSTGFDTACTFNLPRLTASVPSFFNRVSYQWYRDTTKLTGVTTTSMTVTEVSGKYIVKVYDSATGCEYPSAAYTMTIVPPPPAIITYYDSLVFCETSAIVIQGNKGPKYTYRWMRNGIFLAGETDDHLVVDKSGDYSLEVNTPLGCATTSTSIRVKVYPLPTPTVFYAGTDILQTERYYLYQWYRNNVKIGGSDAMGQRFYVREDGAYTVEVTDSNGCTAKSDIYLFSLGVNEDRVSGIKVYPNPAREVLHIEGAEGVGAQLTDLSGRLVAEGKGNGVLSIGHLAEGMYLLNLHDREGKLIRVQKINKVK